MRMDNRIRAYVKNYGAEFVLDVVEKAVKQKEAEEMQMRQIKTDKRVSEVRIIELAKKMGVKLG